MRLRLHTNRPAVEIPAQATTNGRPPGVYETKDSLRGARQLRVVGPSGDTEIVLMVSEEWATAEFIETLWQILDGHLPPPPPTAA